MRRWIAGMIGRRKQRLEFGIELERSHRPIGILGIPARHHRVIVGDAFERIGTRRPWHVVSKAIFPNLGGGLTIPEPVIARAARGILPEEGVGVGLGRAGKILYLSQL